MSTKKKVFTGPCLMVSKADVLRMVKSGSMRTVKDADRVMQFVASTERVDEQGDIVRQNWDLDDFKNNPIVLWNHDQTMPIGRAVKEEVLETGTYGDRKVGKHLSIWVEWMDKSHGTHVEPLFNSYADGFLKGGSVGFIPVQMDPVNDPDERKALGMGDMGVLYNEAKLSEWTLCAVPANPDALTARGFPDSVIKSFAHTRILVGEKGMFDSLMGSGEWAGGTLNETLVDIKETWPGNVDIFRAIAAVKAKEPGAIEVLIELVRDEPEFVEALEGFKNLKPRRKSELAPASSVEVTVSGWSEIESALDIAASMASYIGDSYLPESNLLTVDFDSKEDAVSFAEQTGGTLKQAKLNTKSIDNTLATIEGDERTSELVAAVDGESDTEAILNLIDHLRSVDEELYADTIRELEGYASVEKGETKDRITNPIDEIVELMRTLGFKKDANKVEGFGSDRQGLIDFLEFNVWPSRQITYAVNSYLRNAEALIAFSLKSVTTREDAIREIWTFLDGVAIPAYTNSEYSGPEVNEETFENYMVYALQYVEEGDYTSAGGELELAGEDKLAREVYALDNLKSFETEVHLGGDPVGSTEQADKNNDALVGLIESATAGITEAVEMAGDGDIAEKLGDVVNDLRSALNMLLPVGAAEPTVEVYEDEPLSPTKRLSPYTLLFKKIGGNYARAAKSR